MVSRTTQKKVLRSEESVTGVRLLGSGVETKAEEDINKKTELLLYTGPGWIKVQFVNIVVSIRQNLSTSFALD